MGKTEAAVLVDGREFDRPSSDEFAMILLAVLPLMHNNATAMAANIGFGSGLTAHYLLYADELKRLDNIEIEPAVVEAARLFGGRVANAYDDPRSHFIMDDAKTALVSANRNYDVIVSEPPNPWVSGVASLFSLEFYQLIEKYLSNDGIFVQWLHLYHIDENIVASIYKALKAVFPHIKLYQLSENDVALLASQQSFSSLSTTRMAQKEIKKGLASIGIHSIRDLEAREIASPSIIDLYFNREDVPFNSVFHPYVDNRAANIRFARKNAKDLLYLHNATIVNRIVKSNPIPPTVGINESINFSVANSVRQGSYFMKAYRALKAGRTLSERFPSLQKNAAARLLEILQNCPDDKDVLTDFAKTTSEYHKYLSDEFLLELFEDASSSTCSVFLESGPFRWIATNVAWSQRDYDGVLELTKRWAGNGREVNSYLDSIELKMFLASNYFSNNLTQKQIDSLYENYEQYQRNDPEIRLLLNLLNLKRS